jgi:glycosyltransferase involved in cell wall biosynthesis/tetratricopeptide (TPR) repeat protein
MSRRYLFGPVSREYAEQNLNAAREASACRCFGSEPGLDLRIGPLDTWSEVLARLPDDWRPEFVVLHMQYTTVPAAFAQCPLPILAVAGDWQWLWHGYRSVLPGGCDLVLSDIEGAERLRAAGMTHARAAFLAGGDATAPDLSTGERDIDILFVGNVHPAVNRNRLPILGRLAALHGRWRVHMASGVRGKDYRNLLARARIVFNPGSDSEACRRACDAVAAGALLFQDAGNRDVAQLLREGDEYVAYREDKLETLLERYLGDESERQHIAGEARARLGELRFDGHWQKQLERVEADWPAVCERTAQRNRRDAGPNWVGNVWLASSCPSGPDPSLRTGLAAAIRQRPREPGLLNAFGVLALLSAPGRRESLVEAANAFQDAWSADPRHLVAGLNLAEALVALNQRPQAIDQARRVLAMVDDVMAEADRMANPTYGGLDDPLFPFGFDLLRCEWERAAWQHVGDAAGEASAKATLIRWRVYTMLGQITGDPIHFYGAYAVQPDLTPTCALLGTALTRQSRFTEALPHLEAALSANPLNTGTARTLHDAYGRLGMTARHMALARARRQLTAAAPGLVRPEVCYAEPSIPETDSPATTAALRIVWQGAQDAVHSLALVNRQICAALIERGHELNLRPPKGVQPPGARVELPAVLAARVGQSLSGRADVHVMHQWPPDFTPPAEGRWVMIQPWEFGSVPRAWIGPLRDRVDELWVPSRFVRDCYVRGGVPAHKVHVVPNGVADIFFRDDVPPYPMRTARRFKFLYVGGTLPRKGFDLLLRAYGSAFSDRDDMCLVVKDMGVGTFYQGQTAEAQIEQFRRGRHVPEIEYIKDELSDGQIAALYRACDCVVQPYRGEGFCLPVAEAMASGKPVIATGYGPVLDYATDETAYLLPFCIVSLGEKRIDQLETVDVPFWVEADLDALRFYMRHAYEHPDEARDRGATAREHVRQRLTWDHAAAIAQGRLEALVQRRPLTLYAAPLEGRGDFVQPAMQGRARVSLCMIVKNEAENLPACLESVSGLFDEIIVTDTGSTDDTVAIAERFGAKVHRFAWIKHFAAARNESLRHATGEWIFWMDADDRLDAENRGRLERLIAALPAEPVAYVVKCLCVPKDHTSEPTVVDHVRLFPNVPGLAWEHRIHEQILPSLKRHGVTATPWCDVVVHHVGYQDPVVRQQKLQRDLEILLLEYREQPNHPFTLFNLGMTYRELGKIAEALDFYRRSLAGSVVTDSIVRKLYASIAQCERDLGRPADALRTCREGRIYYPEDAELLLQESRTLEALGELAGAIHCLERLIGGRDSEHFASVTPGLRGHLARHELAQLYFRSGRPDDAHTTWQQVLAERPQFRQAVFGLADVCIARHDAAGLEAIIARLHSNPNLAVETEVLRARLHTACGEYARARTTLEAIVSAHPQALSAWIALSQVLLQEGRDFAAAERALRSVLDIAPNHAASRRHLDTLLRR